MNTTVVKKKRGRKPKAAKEAEKQDETIESIEEEQANVPLVIVNDCEVTSEDTAKMKKKFGKFRFLSSDQMSICENENGADPISTDLENKLDLLTMANTECDDVHNKVDHTENVESVENFEQIENVEIAKNSETIETTESADQIGITENNADDRYPILDESTDTKNIRRSARLQTKQKQKPPMQLPKRKDAENSAANQNDSVDEKPMKMKSRWTKTSELEMTNAAAGEEQEIRALDVQKMQLENGVVIENEMIVSKVSADSSTNGAVKNKISIEDYHQMKRFNTIRENQYLTEKILCKEVSEMVCECFMSREEIEAGELGCGEDCINRLLMIECGSNCSLGDYCANKRFQKFQNAPCVVFSTDKKGLGLKTMKALAPGDFIMEYVGEVLNFRQFEKRALHYSNENQQHYYFMALRNDMIIDATCKGNVSRYINHSCDPNSETQKWTVNGELRIGFFARKAIAYDEEITFDYQYQRYGKQAQKCFCETALCRGWIGEEPFDDESEEDEEEEYEEEEEPENEADEEIRAQAQTGVGSEMGNESSDRVLTSAKTQKPGTNRVKPKDGQIDFDYVNEEDEEMAEEDEEIDVEGQEKTRLKKAKGERLHSSDGTATKMVSSSRIAKPRKRRVTKKKEPAKPSVSNIIMDDLDLDESIRILTLTGLKNQAHTLTLSRLMIRASSLAARRQLLCLVQNGELPCRRLFLDYHGLRLIHTWMEDIVAQPITYPLRIDILQSLSALPIPNRTMVQDSKVLSVVQGWSELTEETISEMSKRTAESSEPNAALPADDANDVAVFDDSDEERKYFLDEVVNLSKKLLQDWAQLKEVFRIPKRDRIEQMKEHEREANKGMNEEKSENIIRSSFEFVKKQPYNERRRWKKAIMKDRNFPHYYGMLSKEARRDLFARRVAREEENARRMAEREQYFQKLNQQNQAQMQQMQNQTGAAVHPIARNPNMNEHAAHLMSFAPQVNFSVPPPNMVMNTVPKFNHMPPQPLLHPQLLPHQQLHPQMQSIPQQPQFIPVPAAIKLPRKWKCAFDKFGRPFYYHIRFRKSQWRPPEVEPKKVLVESENSSSSSEVSSLSSESSSDSDSELFLELQKKILMLKAARKKKISIETNSDAEKTGKRKRDALVEEHLISPLSQEEKTAYSIEANRYRVTKERLKRHKEKHRKLRKLLKSSETNNDSPNSADNSVVSSTRPSTPPLPPLPLSTAAVTTAAGSLNSNSSRSFASKSYGSGGSSSNSNMPMSSFTSEEAKKLKELFRSQMAIEMVQFLNPYRRSDCKQARISNNEDFKHLARKLTHFVMIKELKHCRRIEDLVCNENVKLKAKEFVRKYMLKFGENYEKPADELDDSRTD